MRKLIITLGIVGVGFALWLGFGATASAEGFNAPKSHTLYIGENGNPIILRVITGCGHPPSYMVSGAVHPSMQKATGLPAYAYLGTANEHVARNELIKYFIPGPFVEFHENVPMYYCHKDSKAKITEEPIEAPYSSTGE